MHERTYLAGSVLDEAARSEARALLARASVTSYPVPLFRLAQMLGARILIEPTFGEGSLTREETGYLVRLNPSSIETRRRFTLAHELGHIAFDLLNGLSLSVRFRAPQLSFQFSDEE